MRWRLRLEEGSLALLAIDSGLGLESPGLNAGSPLNGLSKIMREQRCVQSHTRDEDRQWPSHVLDTK